MNENIHKSICQSSVDDKDLTLSSVFVWSSSSLPVDQVLLEAAHFYFNIKTTASDVKSLRGQVKLPEEHPEHITVRI